MSRATWHGGPRLAVQGSTWIREFLPLNSYWQECWRRGNEFILQYVCPGGVHLALYENQQVKRVVWWPK